ncbi:hypothetical protein HRR83_006001 [Exophiala dermatitidis]|uniref:Uncharacterized protein n=1 Tax=Exophiala dermatitidis TaxID=5970 RepID=A0AAN6ISH8_EXODE|nr:hypothetical protein HRR75_004949 [Exophiala dermatitidis]KAJ4514933.1 hypothetical protein HRR74_005398 [Exophiala dermatitidis]KAJ4517424.1 hypothetical protein HRR73_004476 [Exophiala dermatitidis]KAJ4548825.1 hypothetical protein HRR76_001403 [Exophiala dermatitidis]KAJ4552454.1 hypothetical protein HRR77_002466 [Exophiala dermatitidis]
MIVPRVFPQKTLGQKQALDFNEKDVLSRRSTKDVNAGCRSPSRSALSQSLSKQPSSSSSLSSAYKSASDPVKIPAKTERQHHAPPPHRPGPSSIQTTSESASVASQPIPKRTESVHEILSSTTIPSRRRRKPRPGQRLPNCDYVADFSKLLRDDVLSSRETSPSGSWTNPQFEGLFGAIDGLMGSQMIVGSEGVDAGILSSRSISSESMPSLASADDSSSTLDMSSVSPATIRSPSASEHRLRQMASSEDCSSHHPLLPVDDEEDNYDDYSGTTTPELIISPPSRLERRSMVPGKKPTSSFKSSLTASLRALKSAAQTVTTNLTTISPLVQPDDFLSRSIFDFQPSLTDDRRPPPSDEPPSAALRRYLNPHTFVPPDSPAQLHFWVDEKQTPGLDRKEDARPKLKIKRKYQKQKGQRPSSFSVDDQGRLTDPSRSQLPPVVPLATCIPSSIRTAHASSPPTWLEPDGTPSNKHRAAQALWDETTCQEGPAAEAAAAAAGGLGQPRPREPRENRDFLRIFVCEMNMRKAGKLSPDALGHAKLWLPPVDEGRCDKITKNQNGSSTSGCPGKVDKSSCNTTTGMGQRTTTGRKSAGDRWISLSADDL